MHNLISPRNAKSLKSFDLQAFVFFDTVISRGGGIIAPDVTNSLSDSSIALDFRGTFLGIRILNQWCSFSMSKDNSLNQKRLIKMDSSLPTVKTHDDSKDNFSKEKKEKKKAISKGGHW